MSIGGGGARFAAAARGNLVVATRRRLTFNGGRVRIKATPCAERWSSSHTRVTLIRPNTPEPCARLSNFPTQTRNQFDIFRNASHSSSELRSRASDQNDGGDGRAGQQTARAAPPQQPARRRQGVRGLRFSERARRGRTRDVRRGRGAADTRAGRVPGHGPPESRAELEGPRTVAGRVRLRTEPVGHHARPPVAPDRGHHRAQRQDRTSVFHQSALLQVIRRSRLSPRSIRSFINRFLCVQRGPVRSHWPVADGRVKPERVHVRSGAGHDHHGGNGIARNAEIRGLSRRQG